MFCGLVFYFFLSYIWYSYSSSTLYGINQQETYPTYLPLRQIIIKYKPSQFLKHCRDVQPVLQNKMYSECNTNRPSLMNMHRGKRPYLKDALVQGGEDEHRGRVGGVFRRAHERGGRAQRPLSAKHTLCSNRKYPKLSNYCETD